MDQLIPKLRNILRIDDQLLVHVMGGQDKQFFHVVGKDPSFKILVERSILGGVFRIFRFVPSREGLIELKSENIEVLIPRLLELNAGVSLLEFYAVPKDLIRDFEASFLERQIQSFLERMPAVRSIIF